MKAVQINRYGGNEVIEINENAAEPHVSKGQVLVTVHAASLNPVDWKTRSGHLQEFVPLKFPATLGGDFSGVVRKAGEGVSDFAVGNEVYGYANPLSGGSGSFAELVVADAASTALKPQRITHSEAAALPLAGVSALQALAEHIKLARGQKILIHGGAGGIGTIAIQIAKSLGAYVATTVSTEGKAYVKDLGADEIIDYKKEAFDELLHDYDAVFDNVGGETFTKSFKVLKNGGIIVTMLPQPTEQLAGQYGVAALAMFTGVTAERLTRLTELINRGAVKVHIDKIFPLEQAKQAFKHLEEGHPRGKVVLKVRD